MYTVVRAGADGPYPVILKPEGLRPSARPAPRQPTLAQGWAVGSTNTDHHELRFLLPASRRLILVRRTRQAA